MTGRSWDAHAAGTDPDREPTVYGDEFYVRLHGLSHCWTGRLVEDPDGDLRGWFDLGTDGLRSPDDQTKPPSMVHHHRIFPVCFPYGVEAEVERGRGVVVHLRWEPLDTEGPETID